MPQAANAVVPLDALGHYLNEIKGHELLTKKQEQTLARRYQGADDYGAAERLVRANLRLVVKIAREFYNGSGRFPLNDLIQEGNLGLLYAVNKYDPDKQTKFSYYARFWIKAFIHKYLMDNYRLVKLGKTQAQRKLFYNLRKTKEKLRRMGLPADTEQIARLVGVKAAEVEEMENRMKGDEQSLNEFSRPRPQEQIVDNLKAEDESLEDTVADLQMSRKLRSILVNFKSDLNQREQIILERRIVAEDPLTLQKLGDYFGVSRERIRQIEANIIQKLRHVFEDELPDFDYFVQSRP